MNCKECDKGLRKVCRKFKKYSEFKCRLEIENEGIDSIFDELEDEYYTISEEEYEIQLEQREEKREKKKRKKRTYLVED